MATHIIWTIALILLSIKSIEFIKVYIRLLRSGTRTNGRIIAYEGSRQLMILNVAIPKVEFQAGENQVVIAKPINSWFIEINNYKLQKNCIVYYDKSNPSKFTIKSIFELLINLAIVTGAAGSLIWLIIVAL